MRLVLQQFVVLLFKINVLTSVAKNTHFDESLNEESKGRDGRFIQQPIFERRLPQSPFIFQGGDLFDKRKFISLLALLNDNSKGYKSQGRHISVDNLPNAHVLVLMVNNEYSTVILHNCVKFCFSSLSVDSKAPLQNSYPTHAIFPVMCVLHTIS